MKFARWLALALVSALLMGATGNTNLTGTLPSPPTDQRGKVTTPNTISHPGQGAPVTFYYTSNFPLTESPISESSIWTAGGADGLDWRNVQTNGAGAFGQTTVTTYDDNLAALKSSFHAAAANQVVRGVVSRASGYFPTGSQHEIELLLRFNITAHDAHGYEVLFGLNSTSQGYIAVVKWLGTLGSYTAVWDPGAGSISPLVDGDVIQVELRGTSLKIYINGTKIGPATTSNTGVGTLDVDMTKDSAGGALSTWSTGQPGMGFWPQSGSTLTSYGWKSLSIGDLP